MFTLLWELIIGLVVGAVAKFLMPGKDPGGIWITMIIGIAGSILATYLGQAIGWYQAGQGAGFIMSVVGAVVLLRHLPRNHTRRSRPKPSHSCYSLSTEGLCAFVARHSAVRRS